jgi:hypothetical protein
MSGDKARFGWCKKCVNYYHNKYMKSRSKPNDLSLRGPTTSLEHIVDRNESESTLPGSAITSKASASASDVPLKQKLTAS